MEADGHEDSKSKSRRSSSKGSIKIKRQSSGKSGSTKNKKKEGRTGKSSEEPSSPREEPIEMLAPKHNGYVECEGGEEIDEKWKHTASITGMWKKAVKTLKSNDKQNWLYKKGSFIRRKEEEPEGEHQETPKEIDPVYSLLKCAADLPKVSNRSQKEAPCSGHFFGRGDSSSSTSKASSPSSSGALSPTFGGMSPIHIPQSHGGIAQSTSSSSISSATGGSFHNRDNMHHIVDESLGSEFRTFYKLTSPVRKLHSYNSYDGSSKKHSSNATFDHY